MFRNLPLFGFLAGLVIFFYVFYVYQAQNAELKLMKEQYALEEQYASKLKNENVDLKAQLEKYRESETDLKSAKLDASTKLDECEAELRNEKTRADSDKSDLTRLQSEKTKCESQLASLQSEMVILNDTMKAMQTVGVNNEAVIISLNQTIIELKSRLAALIGGNQSVNSGLNPAKPVVIQNITYPLKQQQPLAGNVAAPPVESWNKTESMKQNTAPAGDLRQVIMPPERKEVDIEEHHQIEEPKPIDEAHMVDNMAKDHPIGPGDRVKLDDRKDQFGAQVDDGRLVVPGGEYAENADEGVAVKSRRDNEAVGAAVYSDERQDNEREI